jgi:hypothetical protein
MTFYSVSLAFGLLAVLHGVLDSNFKLLVLACAELGVLSWGRSSLLVQRLLRLRLWPREEVGRHVKVRCGHKSLQTQLSSGHGAMVDSHVPLPWVDVGWPRGVGPTGGTSGGGGLARRATTATAATGLDVVAAAITAIVIFVVVLGLVATGATAYAIGRVR